MMEQTHVSKRHRDTVFVAGFDNMIVTNAAAGLSYISYSALVGTLYIVAEGEERVRT